MLRVILRLIVDRRGLGMAHADRPRARLGAKRRRLRAVAGDVDRGPLA